MGGRSWPYCRSRPAPGTGMECSQRRLRAALWPFRELAGISSGRGQSKMEFQFAALLHSTAGAIMQCCRGLDPATIWSA